MAILNTIVGSIPAGTYPFATLTGNIQLPSETVEELAREGTDGQAYRITGNKSEVAEFIGVVDTITAASARALYAQLCGLQGTLITIYDAHGERYDRLILRKVERVDARRISNAIGGTQGPGGTPSAATHLMTLRFEVQYARGR